MPVKVYNMGDDDVKAHMGTSTTSLAATIGDSEIIYDEYFDIHGRKVSASANSILIRLTKYNDGLSIATKIIK